MIILRRFTRPLFDDTIVVGSNDWGFTRQVDFGGVLGPCCLRGKGVASHGEKSNVNGVVDAREGANMYEEYIYTYYFVRVLFESCPGFVRVPSESRLSLVLRGLTM
jgi:hypothetical protein